ncbi:MAG: response regulator [Deltaproteobacteria bacterium]|nr:response regulator [Deltaproteobacteria bacterium]
MRSEPAGTTPEGAPDGLEDAWRPATFRTLGVIAALGWVAFGVVNGIAGRPVSLAIDATAIVLTLATVLGARRFPAHARWWTHACAAVSAVALVLVSLLSGGHRGDAWVYLALVPLFVGQLLSVREALAWALLSIVGVVIALTLPTPLVEFVPSVVESEFAGVVLVWMAALFAVAARREVRRHLVAVALRGRTIEEQAIELGRARDELAVARDHARALAAARGDFVATLSHELRTPLNGVLGLGTTLLETKLEPEQRELLVALVRSAENQRRLLDDVLELARIEAGRFELVSEPLDLRECLEDVADLFSARAAEHDVELAVIVDRSVPGGVRGDRLRVGQIVANLVSNAVKLTERGRVVIRASGSASDSEHVRLVVRVEDTGPGLAADRMPLLFQAFEQGDPAAARLHGGSGLGLAVSRRIARAMGGDLDVASEVGRGSTFTLSWVAERLGPAADDAEPSGDTLRRAAVIEARPASRDAAVAALRSAGFEPTSFSRLEDALAGLAAIEPVLVLAGDVEGELDVAGVAMRRVLGARQAKLVATASSARAERARRAVLAGAFDAWTLEPLRRSRLVHLDAVPTAERGDHDATALGLPQPTASGPVEALVDEQRAEPAGQAIAPRALVVDDDATNRRVAIAILSRRGWAVVEASGGKDAVARLDRERFDVAFVDLRMPEVDGFEVARRTVATRTANARPVLVAFSASVLGDTRAHVERAGFDDFLEKPIVRSQLDRIARDVEARVARRASELDTSEVSEGSFATLRSMLGDDETRALVEEFVATTRVSMEQLARDLGRGDLGALGSIAHKIAGSSATLGAVQVGALARSIEANARAGDLAALERLAPELHGAVERASAWLESQARSDRP